MLMRFLVAASLASFVSISQAAQPPLTEQTPTPLTGIFRSFGEIEPAYTLDIEIVKGSSKEAQRRLEVLKAEGYTCVLKMSDWRCDKLMRDQAFPADVMLELAQTYSRYEIQFLPHSGRVELIAGQGEYADWLVHGPVLLNGQRFDSYRLRVADEVLKVQIGPSAEKYESLVVRHPRRLDLMVHAKQDEGSGWRSFIAFVVLSPE